MPIRTSSLTSPTTISAPSLSSLSAPTLSTATSTATPTYKINTLSISTAPDAGKVSTSTTTTAPKPSQPGSGIGKFLVGFLAIFGLSSGVLDVAREGGEGGGEDDEDGCTSDNAIGRVVCKAAASVRELVGDVGGGLLPDWWPIAAIALVAILLLK